MTETGNMRILVTGSRDWPDEDEVRMTPCVYHSLGQCSGRTRLYPHGWKCEKHQPPPTPTPDPTLTEKYLREQYAKTHTVPYDGYHTTGQ